MGNDEDDDEDVQFSQVVGKSQAQCTSESLILKMVTEVIIIITRTQQNKSFLFYCLLN